MKPLPPYIAALLGSDDALPRLDVARPVDPSGHGLDLSAALDVDALLSNGIHALRTPPVRVMLPDSPLALWRLGDHAGELIIEPSGLISVLRGEAVPVDPDDSGILLLRSDLGPVTVQQGDWVVDIDAGRVRAWALPEVAVVDAEGSVPGELTIPAWPGSTALLGGRSCPTWLRARAEALADSVDPLDRLAAAGLIVRLWEPGDPAERARALADLRAGQPQPIGATRAWLGDLPITQIRAAVQGRLGALDDAISDLTGLAERAPDLASSAASQVLADRDDLASLCAALSLVGEDCAGLRDDLAAVDRLAGIHLSALAHLAQVDPVDPWLRAVSRHEPEHWWGALLS